MRERVPPLQYSKNPHAKWAASQLACASPPAVYVENGGGNPPIFQVISPFFPFFVHYFLENVQREPPITPKGGILALFCQNDTKQFRKRAPSAARSLTSDPEADNDRRVGQALCGAEAQNTIITTTQPSGHPTSEPTR